MLSRKIIYSLSAVLFSVLHTFSQVPTCGTNVPYFQVNLAGNPAGIWESPGHSRDGNCCGTQSPDRCTSFEVLLDTGAAMINLQIASGAIPTGAMFYQISCGPQIPVGQPICVTGPGPHYITFCKPGNNQNTYLITSIPKPTFPTDQYVRIGCNQNITVLGFDTASVTWNSIFPGAPGAYNSYLSCISACTSPVYTPTTNAPPFVEYLVCGFPMADECGYVAVCDTIRIYNLPSLSGSVSPLNASFCANGPGVLLTASASGGDGNYTFIWRDQSGNIVSTASTYLANTAQIFTVEIRDGLYDAGTCPAIFLSIPVTTVLPPIVSAGPDQVMCTSSPTAYLSGSVMYATGGIWSGGAGTFNPSNTSLITSYTPSPAEITSGVVTLVLTSTGAGGGCLNATDTLKIYYPAVLTSSLSNAVLQCFGGTTTITPVVTGGIGPYQYQWNNGPTSPSIIAGQGTYCVIVTDNIGCSTSVCANITGPTLLNLSMSTTDVTTNGGNDGTATVTASGGTTPYSYIWSNGQTNATATGLVYGVYAVTVTDANGCTMVSSVVVNEPRCLSFQASATSGSLSCFGNLNGTSTATASGGTAPYTYLWNPSGQTNPTATGLSAGTYLVTVTDAGGCLDIAAIVITQPSQVVNNVTSNNATTVGGNEGSATANPNGGTSPFTFLWSSGATTQTITGLIAGTYTITVTDNNGCSVTNTVYIAEPPCNNLVLGAITVNVTCAGGNNGTANAFTVFGNPPYSYSWSNGATTSMVTGLSAGAYTVTVSDAINCTQLQNVTIMQPSPLSLGLTPTNISCSDQNNGTIDLTVSGGTYPYTYAWSNNINVEDQANLGDGNYSVAVTDANGCSNSGSVSITRPDTLLVTAVKTDVTCKDGNNGTINITVQGGSLPYSFLWSNGATTQNISGLSFGQYFLTVIDANGCQLPSQLSVLIDQPFAVAIDSINIDCPVPGSGLASITVFPSGGNNGPYQVSLDSGTIYQTSGVYTFTLPVDSTYYLLVIDGNGCVSPLSDTLFINPELSAQLNFTSCFGPGTLSTPVTVTPVGGEGGLYQISYDNGNTFGSYGDYTDTLAIANTYTIIVRDSLGCTSVGYTITLPSVLNISAGVNQSICIGGSINLNATGTGGTSPYSYLWIPGGSGSSINVSPTASTTYIVVVTDANACSYSDTVNVTVNALPVAVFTSGDPSGCNPLCITFTNTTPATTVFWDFQVATSALNNPTICYSVPGTYNVTLTVTDANGCVGTATSNNYVNIFPLPVADFYATPSVTDMNVSTISFTDNSTGASTWYWTFGDPSGSSSTIQNPIFTYNAPGTYVVTLIVTTSNGCSDTIQLLVSINDYPPLEMPQGISPNSDALNDQFVIHNLGKYPVNTLIIFNRWGNVVYEKSNYTNDWGGENLKGDLLPEGTYFVILRIDEADITLKGYVEIRY